MTGPHPSSSGAAGSAASGSGASGSGAPGPDGSGADDGAYEGFRRALAEARPSGAGPENLVVARRVDSTNLLARRIAGEYLKESLRPPPLLLLAFEQTGGRGRQGRRWRSPAGRGLYATRLVPVEVPPALATLPLLVAAGLARALGRWLPGRCGIKWPNDLVVDGRKIGGVLVEAVSRGQGAPVALVGFGVNHGLTAEELPAREGSAPEATSLTLEAARPPTLAEMTWALVEGVEEELAHLGDSAYAVERIRELSVHRPGDEMRCRLPEGTVEGIFRGFDPRGFLKLETRDPERGHETVRHIAAGEVVER